MNNQFKLLKQENALRKACLSPESQGYLDNIFRYLSKCSRNQYEVQLVMKELIGMSLGAEQQGTSLPKIIGEDKKSFFENIKNNIGKTRWIDYVVTDIFVVFCACFGFNLFSYPVNGFPQTVPIALYHFMNIFLCLVLFSTVITLVSANIQIPYTGNQLNLPSILTHFFILGGLLLLSSFLFVITKGIVLCNAPGFLPPLLYGGISVLLYEVKLRYYDSLAKAKPWRD